MPEVDITHFRPTREMPEDLHSEEPPRNAIAGLQVEGSSNINESTPVPLDEVQTHQLPTRYVPPPVVTRTPFQRLDFSKIKSRTDLMRELAQTLPVNEYALPRYLYRADLLDHNILSEAEALELDPEEHLHNAVLHLDYSQGFPALTDGQPIWSKLPYEHSTSYNAFLQYVDQMGARSLHLLTGWPPEVLQEWFHQNHWLVRAKAYDMFQSAHHDRLRLSRILRTNDNHYLESEAMLKKVTETFKSMGDDRWEAVEIKDLVRMMESLTKIQRSALGLSLTGKEGEDKRPMSVEVAMRQMAKGEDRAQDSVDVDAQSLLQNPDALNAAQELIIKITGGR